MSVEKYIQKILDLDWDMPTDAYISIVMEEDGFIPIPRGMLYRDALPLMIEYIEHLREANRELERRDGL